MADKEPNLYDKEAYNKGYQAFFNKVSIVSNPYHATMQEHSYMDWRIGHVQAQMDKKINEKK